ncbi:MAG: EndoU domain-containing protein [Anaerofustis sp.]
MQGEVPNQTIEAETQTQQDSAELLKGEEDGGRIETEKPNFKTNQEVFDNLQGTERFADQKAVNHVLLGELNRTGKAVGFHYEGMPEPRGKIIEGTKSTPDEHGIYSGKVEVGGVAKKLNNGESSFFPKDWTPQQVIDAINEAYIGKKHIIGDLYTAKISKGITIEMFIDKNGKITSAYPKYKGE